MNGGTLQQLKESTHISELDRENRWSRIYLIPVLQAEHDR